MFFKFNFFTIVWMGVILLLTLVTKHGTANVEYPHFDKVIHLVMFSVLSFLMIVGFTKQDAYSQLRFRAPIYAISIAILYGAVIEVIQAFVPNRDFELLDLASDAVGSFVGYYLYVLVYKIL
ncbi:VanZ family protein [Cyclobacteriaceae bacterium]|nr:VanZ family protein [Cyclobacteriaceae bacterium]